MTMLHCDALLCISNRDGCCCRPSIQICGTNATACNQTKCDSFRPNDQRATNAVDFDHVNRKMPIRCDAEKCVYNKEHQCGADTIRVAGATAKNADQTACETFACRSGCAN